MKKEDSTIITLTSVSMMLLAISTSRIDEEKIMGYSLMAASLIMIIVALVIYLKKHKTR